MALGRQWPSGLLVIMTYMLEPSRREPSNGDMLVTMTHCIGRPSVLLRERPCLGALRVRGVERVDHGCHSLEGLVHLCGMTY